MKLLETIRYEAGELQLLVRHQARMIRSLKALAPSSPMLDFLEKRGLVNLLQESFDFASLEEEKVYKLRLVYDKEGIDLVEALVYKPLAFNGFYIKEISPEFDYQHKYLDRTCFDELMEDTRAKEGQVPIFVREGLLTDTHFSNIVLQIKGELYTPEKPLLKGVMREELLARGQVKVKALSPYDLEVCEKLCLLNAMLPLGRMTLLRNF